jgi:hypothetical protein
MLNFIARRIMRRSREPIPETYQVMLFWAGLRGAVAVALATSLEGPSAAAVRTSILCVVVISILLFGSTTTMIVQKMGIRTGMHPPSPATESETSDQESMPNTSARRSKQQRRTTSHTDEYIYTEAMEGTMLRELEASHDGISFRPSSSQSWWTKFDKRWLIPIFVRQERAARLRRQYRRQHQYTHSVSRSDRQKFTSPDSNVRPAQSRSQRVFGQRSNLRNHPTSHQALSHRQTHEHPTSQGHLGGPTDTRQVDEISSGFDSESELDDMPHWRTRRWSGRSWLASHSAQSDRAQLIDENVSSEVSHTEPIELVSPPTAVGGNALQDEDEPPLIWIDNTKS